MVVLIKNTAGFILKYSIKPEIKSTCIGIDLKSGLKLNFLLAIKIPNVKWSSIIIAAIELAIEKPLSPYANRQIGRPKLPVFGSINGLSSVTGSLLSSFKTITPKIEKQITKRKVNNPNLTKVEKFNVLEAAKE